jgi:hypothetical protein
MGGRGGGGGGFFSIPPEKVSKINLPVVCLDHGKKDPTSSVPYTLIPAEEHVDRAEVIVLLKALGRGEVEQHAAQAAVWHLNNNLSWQELATKLQGTVRTFNRPPYFTQREMHLALTYANEAKRRAQLERTDEQYKETYEKSATSDEAYQQSSDLGSRAGF